MEMRRWQWRVDFEALEQEDADGKVERYTLEQNGEDGSGLAE